MNYCSIQEAWGKNDYITNQYKKFNNPVQQKNNSFQQRNIIENKNSVPKKTLEKFTSVQNKLKKHISKIDNCNDFMKHLNVCKKCQTAIRNKYRPKILENFTDIIETNKDIIVLILIGISILLFFNLINSLN
jgi:uncharacterized protein with PIN domain